MKAGHLYLVVWSRRTSARRYVVHQWVAAVSLDSFDGMDPQRLQRTKATLIYKRTKNPQGAVQRLLGHAKL